MKTILYAAAMLLMIGLTQPAGALVIINSPAVGQCTYPKNATYPKGLVNKATFDIDSKICDCGQTTYSADTAEDCADDCEGLCTYVNPDYPQIKGTWAPATPPLV
jgi:hypothetical protein